MFDYTFILIIVKYFSQLKIFNKLESEHSALKRCNRELDFFKELSALNIMAECGNREYFKSDIKSDGLQKRTYL